MVASAGKWLDNLSRALKQSGHHPYIKEVMAMKLNKMMLARVRPYL